MKAGAGLVSFSDGQRLTYINITILRWANSTDGDATFDVQLLNPAGLCVSSCMLIIIRILIIENCICLSAKAGFPAKRNARNELTQRKEHNEITSLLDRPMTAASDYGVYAAGTLPSCGRHARNY